MTTPITPDSNITFHYAWAFCCCKASNNAPKTPQERTSRVAQSQICRHHRSFSVDAQPQRQRNTTPDEKMVDE